MLGKVMKYEAVGLGRTLLPAYGLALGISLLFRLIAWIVPAMFPRAESVVFSIISSFSVLLISAIFIVTFIFLIVRFYQAFCTGEGYMTLTLPVSTSIQILGRLFMGIIYSIIATLLSFVAAFIILPGLGVPLFELFTDFPWEISSALIPFLAILVLFFLASVAMSLTHAYVSIAIGSQFKHRVLASVITAYVLNWIESILYMILSAIIFSRPFFVDLFTPSFSGSVVYEMNGAMAVIGAASSDSVIFANAAQVLSVLNIIFIVFTIFMLITTVINFFITRYIFTKRINLE